METLANILLIITMFSSLGLLIFGWVDMCRFTKRMKKDHESAEKLIDKKAKEIKEGIGKELAEALKENTRLEKLSDQVLADLEEKNKEIEQLRSAKTALKKENRELKEQLLAKSEDAKKIDIQVK